jgi:hypothetical protein
MQSYMERDPSVVAAAELAGYRTMVCVPMLKDNELIGAISIYLGGAAHSACTASPKASSPPPPTALCTGCGHDSIARAVAAIAFAFLDDGLSFRSPIGRQ